MRKCSVGNWKIAARPHSSLTGIHHVAIRLWLCFKFTSRIWFLQMPRLLEMNYLSRAWIMRKTLPWISFSTSVAFSLVISTSLHFPPINNKMTPLEMQDRWLKWDPLFVETTQNRGCRKQINTPRDYFLARTLSSGHSDVNKPFQVKAQGPAVLVLIEFGSSGGNTRQSCQDSGPAIWLLYILTVDLSKSVLKL